MNPLGHFSICVEYGFTRRTQQRGKTTERPLKSINPNLKGNFFCRIPFFDSNKLLMNEIINMVDC